MTPDRRPGPAGQRTPDRLAPSGARLVGGGGYLRTQADPATANPPTNGLVLGGTAASTGLPVDLVAGDGTVDPASWLSKLGGAPRDHRITTGG